MKNSNLKGSIYAGIAFGFIIGIFQIIINGLQFALIAAPVSGLCFALLIYFFISSKFVKKQTQISNHEQSSIIISGNANHYQGFEAVGGKLYLLQEQLKFKSHKLNIQSHEQEIKFEHIKKVGFYNTIGLIPNGLIIETIGGKKEKFVIGNRRTWKREIEKRLLNKQ